MNEHKCPKCNFIFKRKDTLITHLNKKKSCLSDEKKIKCEFCSKMFVKQYNLTRHLNICKKKINEMEILKIKNEELKNEIEKIKNNNPIVQNITINNNTTNIQNNFHFNDYGKEDITQINLYEILERKADVIPKILYDLHCSIDRPENYNVGIKSLKRYQAHVRQNGEWIERNKKEVLTEILNKITNYISEQHYEDCKTLGVKEANNLYSNALKEIKVIDPTEYRYVKEQLEKTLHDLEYIIHSNKTRIFSDKIPIIKQRENIKSVKRDDLL
jgi:uncharacterized C2H2 Zn-finger protein